MSDPSLHLLPVFSWDDEAGWLLLVPKADPAIRKALRSIDAGDDISPERGVKGWWVSQGLQDRVRTALSPRAFCPQCAMGVPCNAWDADALSFHEFEARAPDITVRKEWEKAVQDVLRGLHEEGPKYIKSFVRAYSKDVMPKEEAGILGGLVDSLFAAAETILGQNAGFIPPNGTRPASGPGPAPGSTGMSAERACAILHMNADATPEQIKRAFVMRSMQWHPDKVGTDPAKLAEAHERMKEILEARRVLSGS